jgi:hypothetical protein
MFRDGSPNHHQRSAEPHVDLTAHGPWRLCPETPVN